MEAYSMATMKISNCEAELDDSMSPAVKETLKAMDDINNHRGLSRTFDSVDELMEDLNK